MSHDSNSRQLIIGSSTLSAYGREPILNDRHRGSCELVRNLRIIIYPKSKSAMMSYKRTLELMTLK